jgi:hypothetical protein
MDNENTVPIFLTGFMVGGVVGVIHLYIFLNAAHEKEMAKHGCAYFDSSVTGAYKLRTLGEE